MRKSRMILACMAFLAVGTGQAAEKLYQAEGNVTAVRQDSFVILNDQGENIEFNKEIQAGKDFPQDLKEGDHVRIRYRMDATKVEKTKRAQAPGQSGHEPFPKPQNDDRIFYDA